MHQKRSLGVGWDVEVEAPEHDRRVVAATAADVPLLEALLAERVLCKRLCAAIAACLTLFSTHCHPQTRSTSLHFTAERLNFMEVRLLGCH